MNMRFSYGQVISFLLVIIMILGFCLSELAGFTNFSDAVDKMMLNHSNSIARQEKAQHDAEVEKILEQLHAAALRRKIRQIWRDINH